MCKMGYCAVESSYFLQVLSSLKYDLLVHHILQQELLHLYHVALE